MKLPKPASISIGGLSDRGGPYVDLRFDLSNLDADLEAFLNSCLGTVIGNADEPVAIVIGSDYSVESARARQEAAARTFAAASKGTRRK